MVKARDAGSAIGGFLNNPGTVAIIAIIAGLFIFRKPIQEAFEGLAGSVSGLLSPSGAIQQAGQDAGQFVFNIGQEVGGAVFDTGQQAGQAVFDAGKEFGDFLGGAQNQIDQALSNFFKVQQSNFDIFLSNLGKDVTETVTDPIATAIGGDFEAINKFLDSFGTFGQKSLTAEQQGILPFATAQVDTSSKVGELDGLVDLDPVFFGTIPDLDVFSFAEQFGITPVESFTIGKQFGGLDFSAIAAIPTFGEVLAENPELTASQIANLKFIQAGGGEGFDFGTNTGIALQAAEGDFGLNPLSVNLLKEAEAIAAMKSLGGFVGGDLFGNPDFPITLGESFLGEAGTVVSPSISNLSESELKDFIERFG